jgi:hypothetical protein
MAGTRAQESAPSDVYVLGVMGMHILSAVQRLVDVLLNRYRPELHYMRGPGPKWQERHPGARVGGDD